MLVDKSVKLEEEVYQWYSHKTFYPVRLGEIFQARYQVICKLGYGTASTTWLCRDLHDHRYVTIKVYAVGQAQVDREVAALKHIDSAIEALEPKVHIGIYNIRRLLDWFEIPSPAGSGTNLCLIHEPLGISLGDLRKLVFDGRIPVVLVKGIALFLLRALDFLHRRANLVHTDIQEDNVLFTLGENQNLKEIEEEEMTHPSARKVYSNHTIYQSRMVTGDWSEDSEIVPVPVLCDFGEARFGKQSYDEEVMPDLYRAPEILLGIEWNEKVDIWALGLTLWVLVEGKNLFVDNKGGRWKSALPHMARMVSLLGPPPQDVLDMSPESAKSYFNKKGKLKGGLEVTQTSLEQEMTALEGDEKKEFLRFLRRLLQWDPRQRPSARQLLGDPWLKDTSENEGE
ncbi:hypothetical protein VTK56DRAFT_9410 [Thermocarpiscus australiensis]